MKRIEYNLNHQNISLYDFHNGEYDFYIKVGREENLVHIVKNTRAVCIIYKGKAIIDIARDAVLNKKFFLDFEKLSAAQRTMMMNKKYFIHN